MNLSLLSARSFPRKASQTSIFLQEWDIPFEQLEVGELIGKGRFGQVYHGRWHGEGVVDDGGLAFSVSEGNRP